MKSEKAVFIIESLKLDDEKKDRYEGLFLSQILRMSEIETIYYYIRTKEELEVIVDEFHQSNFRYLHISCHGNTKGISTTLHEIAFEKLALTLSPRLDNRRLFLSACSAANEELAKRILTESDCYSLIGPNTPIDFDDAAVFWASFYHLMLKNETMQMKELKQVVQDVSGLFSVSMSYFTKSRSEGFRRLV